MQSDSYLSSPETQPDIAICKAVDHGCGEIDRMQQLCTSEKNHNVLYNP